MNETIQQILEEAIQQEREVYASINDYAIEIGVVSADAERKKLNVGITNAELMFVHENGSSLKHIPARPVLELTIKDAIKKLLPDTINRIYDGCFKQHWSKAQVKNELEKMCVRMQSMARRMIYKKDSRLPANKPSTIKAKGSDVPLLDTGQLARSITCRLVLLSNSENGP